jgi:hypothetical protein
VHRPPPSLVLALLLGAALRLAAQEPPQATVQRLAAVEAAVVRVTAAHADAIWPGFRPDTIPVLYVVPGAGVLLLNWATAGVPDGFAPVSGLARAFWQPAAVRTAASTGTTLAGRSVAQVFVFPDANDAQLFGTTVHEAFHVFEHAGRREGRRFRSGENAFLVSSYPIFDPANEAGVALEGRLLARALAAPTRAGLTAQTREFVAAREARQRTLGSDYTDFETLGELNEGLAEYTLVRVLGLVAGDASLPWSADAEREVAHHRAQLDSLTTDARQSLRLRFYVTGPAMGLVLDRLEGPAWKESLVRRDLTVQDALAEASGYRTAERALLARAARAVDTAALGRSARAAIARLRALRRAQVDSVLAQPGVTIVLRADSLPGRSFGLCGIDPQNLLQVDATLLLHTRWVRPCASGVSAEFTTATVQDRAAGTFTAVAGPDDSVKVSAGGRSVALHNGEAVAAATDVRVESPGLTLQAARAALVRRGWVLEIFPKGR